MSTETTHGQHIGQVKWFNNRRGYGFLSIVSQERRGEDIFVHQTNIAPSKSSFRTLRANEYVSLDIKNDGEKNQAVNVSGVFGGPLMCDASQPRRTRPGESRNEYTEEASE